MSRGNGNDLLALITGADWSQIDSLPLSAKILLASRLMDGVQVDLGVIRENLWHDHDATAQLPRLGGSSDIGYTETQ